MPMERRRIRKTRYPLQPPLAAETQDETGQVDCGTCWNVSVSGVCLWQERPICCGSALDLTLRLRPGVALCVAGRVMWARPDGRCAGWVHGIRFSADLRRDTVMEAAKHAAQPPPSNQTMRGDICCGV
jgi:hypothetical protein